jgi:hypothetical protein
MENGFLCKIYVKQENGEISNRPKKNKKKISCVKMDGIKSLLP